MKLLKKISALVLSLAVLVSPAGMLAESAFSAGDLTAVTLQEYYAAGEQINLTASFGMELGESLQTEKTKALASLLSKCVLEMSFYDDFGTARIHADMIVDGVDLAAADVLVFEDGSVQMMTSLTGNYVMTLPAGTLVDGRLNLDFGEEVEVLPIEHEDYRWQPLKVRAKHTTEDLISSVLGMLLGWVSQTHMERGDLYTFDNDYIEETDTRDAVVQRMVGKIHTSDFIAFLWRVAATLKDNHPEFQRVVADVLEEKGVTRGQLRSVIDTIFTEETVDPAVDWVERTEEIADPDYPVKRSDVEYFFVKLHKCIDNLWHNTIEDEMSMIVSYDENGETVGFDAVVPRFTEVLPYEGDFTYSVKTDEDWQRLYTSHGELQVLGNNRVIGDLNVQLGEDVDGVNASYAKGYIDLMNMDSGNAIGLDVNAGLDYTVSQREDGLESEMIEGHVVLSQRENGLASEALNAGVTFSGETVLTEDGFTLNATALVSALGMANLVTNVTIERAEYEDIVFAGGQAIDLSKITQADIEAVKSQVVSSAAGVGVKLITHPSVLSDAMTLVGK